MKEKLNQVYIMQNWFKSIFLQVYLDLIREDVFIEAKKRGKWITPQRTMFFEENCYIRNNEILKSFSLVFQELELYNLCSAADTKNHLITLEDALNKNEREKYIDLLVATHKDNEQQGIFSFSDDFKFLKWHPKDGSNFYDVFRTMVINLQKHPTLVKHPLNIPDHFALFLILNLLPLDHMSLDIPYATHPLPGIGKSHTHLSITDPGRGHRQSTIFHPAYFLNNYIHVEHLERLGKTRQEIESYRIPNILDFALLRACVGNLAPVTTYVGRPMHEYSGAYDRLKAAHLTSAAISAFFSLGAAEVKVAFDPLTVSDGIDYLCRLMTFRSHPRQVISIAFNLNREWIDDRIPEQVKRITNKKEIGLLGIEITIIAGWDKITWDGAGDTYPSECIMNQLNFQTALTLVHLAHEKGLTTYFSGGFKIGQGHIAQAVFTGVDGIGIGGGQVLRLIDKEGHEGPFLEENIDFINKERDEAEVTIRGKAARILSCLDRLYYEGSLLEELESVRQHLFESMLKLDENAISAILTTTVQYDLPIDKDYLEEEYELLTCQRILKSGEKSVSYLNLARDSEAEAKKILNELAIQIAEAQSIPKNVLRIYYTDVFRRYRALSKWNPENSELRCKFYKLENDA